MQSLLLTITHINAITRNAHIEKKDFGGQKLFTTVRDPIDHFLSGWAECGFRSMRPNADPAFKNYPAFNMDLGIDEQVQSWVKCVQGSTLKGDNVLPCKCSKHSYPQANFLLENDGQKYIIDPLIDLVGDLKDLPRLVEMTGFGYGRPILPKGRDSSMNLLKIEKFPRDKTLLSDETLQRICDFVILDYYFFDYKPPEICRDQIEADIASIEKVSLED